MWNKIKEVAHEVYEEDVKFMSKYGAFRMYP